MKNNNEEKDLNIINPEDLEEVKNTAEEAMEVQETAVEILQAADEAIAAEEGIDDADAEQDVDTDNTDADNTPEYGEEAEEKKKVSLKIVLIAAVLVAAIVLVGIYTYVQITALATYKGGRVTKNEFEQEWELTVKTQGITEEDLNNPAYSEQVQALKDDLLMGLARQEVFFAKLRTMDMDKLPPEEEQLIRDNVETELDSYATQSMDYILAELPEDATEKDVEKAVAEYKQSILEEGGYKDLDDYVEFACIQTIIENAYYDLLPDEEMAPTDEEMRAEYDEILEDQKTRFDADTNTYFTEMDYTEFILYRPAGIRSVRHVLISIDEETKAEIQNLMYSGDTEGYEKLRDEALAGIETDAQEVLDMLNAGEISFEDAVAEYSADGITPDGYQVCEGYVGYVPEFTEGSMALENVGDISGLVGTMFGYHIIEYYKDIPAETIPYEDVMENMKQSGIIGNRNAAWVEMLDNWYREMELDFKDDSLNKLVFGEEENTSADTVE